MNQEHYRRLERMYLGAPTNEIYRPKIRISEGEAEISIEVGPHFHHAARSVHGSHYFKALDDAAFFAVNSLPAMGRALADENAVEALPTVAVYKDGEQLLQRTLAVKEWPDFVQALEEFERDAGDI